VVAIVAGTEEELPAEPELTNEIIDLSQKPTVFIDGLVYHGGNAPP
jgi:hypothetical protein